MSRKEAKDVAVRRVKGMVLVCTLLVWAVGGSIASGQGKTRVQLNSIENSELQNAVEKNASAVITEFNRAETFNELPNLSDLPVTDRARKNIMSRWEEAPFFCNRTKLALRMEPQEGEMYEIREIPLMVGGEEQRNAIMTLNEEAEVIGFRYSNEPATGTIIVASEPSGAIVESAVTDGTAKAPIQFDNVPEGEYWFTIRKESYQTVDTTLSVRAYHSLRKTIQLTPTFGYLRIQGGAETIKVDGVEHSPSENGRIQVDVGKHVVTLSRKYYQTYDTTLTVTPGQTELVSAEFQRKRVPMRVFSNPTGATVMIDGDSAGTAPLLTTREAGRAYSLRVAAEGYVPSKRMNIFAAPDSVIEREVTLSPVNIRAGDEGVTIENVRVERSAGLVTITYDLLGTPDETYEVKLGIRGPDGAPIEIGSDVIRGAIGENVAPGRNKKIYWREELPEGAAMQITQGPPSVATSLTVGYFATDFHLNGNRSDSPYDFDRPLKTFMFTGKSGLFSVGYDKSSSPQSTHWIVNSAFQLGGNVHVFRNRKYSSLLYMPIRLQGYYVYTGLSESGEEDAGNRNVLNVGIGTGIGVRLRIGRFPEIRSIPVLNELVVEGSLILVPSGYFNLNNEGFDNAQISRSRNVSLEIKIVDLIGTGAERGVGITFGFTRRTLSRTFEGPENLGEALDSAFAPGNLERISTQRLFRFGINWQ